MTNDNRLTVALIGFGRMGEKYLQTMKQSGRWTVKYICDKSPIARELSGKQYPEAVITDNDDIVFGDPEVEVVVLSALADSRLEQIRKAVASGKHIISEKPIAATVEEEEEAVRIVSGSKSLSAVNLYLRDSWYHKEMKDFVKSGEIGELAIIRICHMTPGLAPGEGHKYEGPPFHDCGLHYVDIARYHAESEYATWHSQGIRMWNYEDPWWVQSHGTFANGIVFDITQGFVYGQLSKDQTHNSYIELIGTKGLVRMTHDFKTAHVEMRGVTRTEIIDKPFGGKNLDVLCDKFADAVEALKKGENAAVELPCFEDAFIASRISWAMLRDAESGTLPAIGDEETLKAIRDRRSKMTNGYGLLKPR